MINQSIRDFNCGLISHGSPSRSSITVTWGLDDEATNLRVKAAHNALESLKFVVEQMQTPAPRLPNFRNYAVVLYWKLALTVNNALPQVDEQDSSEDGALQNDAWSSIPERPFGRYKRTRVENDELKPYQKNRGNNISCTSICVTKAISIGVCKMWMRCHENSQWYSGTGWLLDEQTVITAAHNVNAIGRNRKAEHVKNVVVSSGYSGKKTVTTNDVEIRRGKAVVVHSGYYAKDSKSHHSWWEKYDLAAIRLDKPFQKAEPFRWVNTPPVANHIKIQVVGYPDDLPTDDIEEQGHVMYSSEQTLTYDLQRDQKDQLDYVLDTNSGRKMLSLVCVTVKT